MLNLEKEKNDNPKIESGYYLGTDIEGMASILDTAPAKVNEDKTSIQSSDLYTECGKDRLFLKIELPHLGGSEDLGCRSKYDLKIIFHKNLLMIFFSSLIDFTPRQRCS